MNIFTRASMQSMLVICFFLIMMPLISTAQEVEMADDFRGEGKIYVVVAVVISLITGIFIQLFRMEKKIKSLEKENLKK